MNHLLRLEYIELDFSDFFFVWAVERSIVNATDHELQFLCNGWEL